jgi:prevent-host-death family protein
MRTIPASKVRETFAKVLEAVQQRDECVIVVRYGQPLAALVSIDRLDPQHRKQLRTLRDGPAGSRLKASASAPAAHRRTRRG